jgi:3'-5' exoribonuclease
MPLHKPRTINLKSLAQLNKLPLKSIFNGTYRIGNIKKDMKGTGNSHLRLDLHDATGFQIGQCETSVLTWLPTKPYQLVNVQGYLEQTVDHDFVHILCIEPANIINSANVIQSLPRKLCLDPAWLDRLDGIRRSIDSPALCRFVDTIFSDDEIALAFLQVPASSKHHHNKIGGLLAHSVEVAEITADLDYASEGVRDIAVVAALLHDLGKVRTLTTSLASTTLGKMVGHDSLTLEICALALRQLDKTWPDAANTLRHVWTCASPAARYGFEANCTMVQKIQYADKLSVERYYDQQTFTAMKKTTGLAWDGKKYYWRPSDEPKSNERSNICL